MPEPTETTAAAELTPRKQRERRGREVRSAVPRSSLGEWSPASDRDPNGLLAAQDATRDQGLVPLRHERMGVSPFTYYRGAAAVFSADMAAMARTGLEVQLCGDAHLANFGAFASPDRTLVFDLNDFDETLPGPFEWDLRRLVASFEVAARHRSFDEPTRVQVVTDCVLAYVRGMRELSRMANLDVWYARMTVEEIAQRWGQTASKTMIRRFQRTVDKAKSKDRLRAFEKLVAVENGQARFRSDPPVLVPARELVGVEDVDALWETISGALDNYRDTLAPDRQVLLDRYRFVDLARKVVGVGSVGTRCWVALLLGDDDGDPLFIQVKEAQAHARTGDSVAIAAYLGGGRTAVSSLLDFAARYADQTEADHRAFI